MKRKIIGLSFPALLLISLMAAISFAGTIQLPKTGQMKCYGTEYLFYPELGDWYEEIVCAGTGQDGDIRAGR